VEKAVWDGEHWLDADEITGPFLVEGNGMVEFRVVITNCGNVPLSSISVFDSMLNDYLDLPSTTLAVAASMTFEYDMGWIAGQQTNTASASGWFDGEKVTDDDDANYFGADPVIVITKYVWDGDSWEDANVVTGPMLAEGNGTVWFKVIVTNNGNVPLSDITVWDSDLGEYLVLPSETLAVSTSRRSDMEYPGRPVSRPTSPRLPDGSIPRW
jgi:uncharacterized repeat protein (TIGR01451 family)